MVVPDQRTCLVCLCSELAPCSSRPVIFDKKQMAPRSQINSPCQNVIYRTQLHVLLLNRLGKVANLILLGTNAVLETIREGIAESALESLLFAEHAGDEHFDVWQPRSSLFLIEDIQVSGCHHTPITLQPGGAALLQHVCDLL